MDQIAKDAFDEATRKALFAELRIDPATLEDLGGFESFVFRRNDTNTILRVTHTSHRDLGQVLAELEFIEYLAAHDAAVCRPVPQGEALANAWRDFVVCEFPVAQGHLATKEVWGAALFTEWGRAIGQFHRLTRDYSPIGTRRPDCAEDSNFDLVSLMPEGQPDVMAKAADCQAQFLTQPRHDNAFGLIHSDAHVGNFYVDDGKLTFFDFDDACYCWFSYDLATLLLSAVLQSWLGKAQADMDAMAREFLPRFLDGYSAEYEVTDDLLAQLPLALTFREICLYGVILKFVSPEESNWYTERFMAGRRERIVAGEPYVDLSFLR